MSFASAEPRKKNPKLGEFAQLDVDLERPAMLLHNNIVTEGKPESHPFTGPLGGENGLKILSFTSGRSRNATLSMYARVSVIRHRFRHIFARAGSVAAKAAARNVSSSGSAIKMVASGKILGPLCTIASKAGCVSIGEVLISSRISAVAAC
jgi:hypothetical protein